MTFTSRLGLAESLTQTNTTTSLPGPSDGASGTQTAQIDVSEAQSKFNLTASGLLQWPYRISSQRVWQETTEKSNIISERKKKKQ